MSKTEFSVQLTELPLKSRPWELSLVDPSSFPVLNKFYQSHIPISLFPVLHIVSMAALVRFPR